jgi:hypothetical protein
MIGHWDSDGGIAYLFLHDNVTAALANLYKAMVHQDIAYVAPRQYS